MKYSNDIIMNNLDITDYSAEKFPKLDTTFEAPAVMDNGASASFNGSYASGVITRDATTKAEYLHNGAEFAFKVSAKGAGKYAQDQIGIIESAENCSLTNWDNVVLTADVYNETDFDLQMGILFVESNQIWLNGGKIENTNFLKPITLKAGEWTTVAWSMKALGILSNVLEGGIGIQVKTGPLDKASLPDPNNYAYSLAIANWDFVNYSSEKFSDLDTNEPALATMNNKASESFRDSYKAGSVSRTLTIDPTYLKNNSEFAFKVDVSSSAAADQIGIISSAQACSLTSWDNVVLTADVYNATDRDLEIGLLFATKDNQIWLNDGKIPSGSFLKPFTLAANSWTTVAWSMKSAFGITSDLFTVADIQIKTRIKDTSGLTAPYVYSLAITNLDFVDYSEEKFPNLDLYHGEFNNNVNNFNRELKKATETAQIATVSFEYAIKTIETNGSVKVAIRKDTDMNNILGFFEFTADGAKTTYDGVTVTDLGNGYHRVVIALDQVAQKVGEPALSDLNVIHFARGTDATYYVANIQVTFNSAV